MRIVVLGAGIVGTASAWYLAQAGHEVTVIDRQPVAGNETSFANGSQISVSHAEPWANPHVLPQVLKWLGREDAPLLWRWRADKAQLAWGLAFLRECLPSRTRQNIAAIVHLALHSRTCLQQLRDDLKLNYDQLTRGILHIYTDQKAYRAALKAAEQMNEFGLDRRAVDAAQCLEIEPALQHSQLPLAGGDFTPSDESGDAHQFTRQLAQCAAKAGVDFFMNTTVDRISQARGRVDGVWIRTDDSPIQTFVPAEACVVALGSYSPAMVKPLGVRLPVYPAKGYSATLNLTPDTLDAAPVVSLTDDERKLVFSRLGNRLRIAGTAEFNGFNLEANPVRCEALMSRARAWFPGLRWDGEPAFWCGLRPATPSNVPLIGHARTLGGPENLWLNTGHGTLGWTMGCGSGQALADLICKRSPLADFPFLPT